MDIPTTYCESFLGIQLLNIISSLVFIILGGILFSKQKHTDVLVRLITFFYVMIGVSSILWHYTSLVWADYLDTISIALFSLLLTGKLIYGLVRNMKMTFFVTFIILLVALQFEKVQLLNGSLVYLFLLAVLIVVLICYSKHIEKEFIFRVAFTFLVGLFFRTIDLDLCPTVFLGTHFIRHIFIALFGYFMISHLHSFVEK